MLPIADENEPGAGIAWVNLAFISVNVAVFLLLQQGSGDNAFTYGFSTVPAEITTGRDILRATTTVIDGQRFLIPQAPGPDPIYLTLLSSMFMHGSWLHLGGNMLFLWIFGDNVERTAGPFIYLLFYLVAGIVASLAQVFVDPTSTIPSLGASGAISGVLGAYIVLFPRNRVTVFTFPFLFVVPAIVAIGIWAVFQFLNGLGSVGETAAGGVAYLAHIGGFLFGLLGGLFLRTLPGARRPPRRGLPPPF
jgi:membrane associated rhomboid family serine protease